MLQAAERWDAAVHSSHLHSSHPHSSHPHSYSRRRSVSALVVDSVAAPTDLPRHAVQRAVATRPPTRRRASSVGAGTRPVARPDPLPRLSGPGLQPRSQALAPDAAEPARLAARPRSLADPRSRSRTALSSQSEAPQQVRGLAPLRLVSARQAAQTHP